MYQVIWSYIKLYQTLTKDLPAGTIEHTSLPSGLHTCKSDLVLFTHGEGDIPGVGLFRSVEVESAGRGRRMGTLGVVLGGFFRSNEQKTGWASNKDV